MTLWYADHACLDDDLVAGVQLEVDQHGRLAAVRHGVPQGSATRLGRLLLPGIPNAHSHVFQRLIAGRTEHRANPADDFWSWREAMYACAGRLDPAQLYELARFAYGEMLAAGYTQVCEFHYLHLDPHGRAYADPAAMALALVEAARSAGIALTLLPTLYLRGGFDGRALAPRQQRFGMPLEPFVQMLERLRGLEHERLRIGCAIHSLRAVGPEALAALLAAPVTRTGPIHIHIAEQLAEVEQCRAATGTTPIRWLLDHAAVDARWHLVHATHADADEIELVARAGAGVVLCPSTEANLGDGLFGLPRFLDAGGVLSIGSDSHVELDPFEELKLAEYGQRLQLRQRNVCAGPGQPHVAARLLGRALAGGAAAADLPVGRLEVGRSADFLVYEPPAGYAADAGAALLDTLVFGRPKMPVRTYLGGREVGVPQGAEGFERLRGMR